MVGNQAVKDYLTYVRKELQKESETSDTAQLLENYILLLANRFHRFTKKRNFSEQEKEDMLSHTVVALLDAFTRFDPKRGTQMSTYVSAIMDGALKNYLRENSRDDGSYRGRLNEAVYNISLDEPLQNISEGEELFTLKEILDSGDKSISNAEKKIVLEQCMMHLGADELYLFKQHYQEGRTLRSLAEEQGVPVTSLSDYIAKGLKRVCMRVFHKSFYDEVFGDDD